MLEQYRIHTMKYSSVTTVNHNTRAKVNACAASVVALDGVDLEVVERYHASEGNDEVFQHH